MRIANIDYPQLYIRNIIALRMRMTLARVDKQKIDAMSKSSRARKAFVQ